MIQSENQPPSPLLRMRGIEKTYPGVHALCKVDLDLHSGEVLALLGENGAGKSTLIKTLSGAVRPDAGMVEIDGHPAGIHSPIDAQRARIGVIYQEFNLVPALSVRENIFLGQEKTTGGFLQAQSERRQAVALFEKIGVNVSPDALCRDLTIAQQQVVEIAKALSLDARILVMDEPTAALTPPEVHALFEVVRGLKAQGMGVIFITHRLDDIYELADRVIVLRDGGNVGGGQVSELSRERLIELMVGRPLKEEFPTGNQNPRGNERLVVQGLSRKGAVHDLSFSARGGEILALCGLVGAGRTEVARLLFGADRRDTGKIILDGKELSLKNPAEAIRNKICLLTEDRKSQGLVLGQSVRENFSLPNLSQFTRMGFIERQEEEKLLAVHVERLAIRISGPQQLTGTLSGGNQQKVVLAKWLQQNCEVVIFDEPTRGIDVKTKYEIYVLMQDLAAQGKVVIMISSELPEVLGVADRILVMHNGRITGEINDVGEASQEDIMRLAVL